jgi:hypothetical protein
MLNDHHRKGRDGVCRWLGSAQAGRKTGGHRRKWSGAGAIIEKDRSLLSGRDIWDRGTCTAALAINIHHTATNQEGVFHMGLEDGRFGIADKSGTRDEGHLATLGERGPGKVGWGAGARIRTFWVILPLRPDPDDRKIRTFGPKMHVGRRRSPDVWPSECSGAGSGVRTEEQCSMQNIPESGQSWVKRPAKTCSPLVRISAVFVLY